MSKNHKNNEQNLKRYSSEEARRFGSVGGKKSVEVRRRKRAEREALKELFEQNINDFPQLANIAKKLGVSEDDTLISLWNKLVVLNEFKKNPDFQATINYQKIIGEYCENCTRAESDNNAGCFFESLIFSEKQNEFFCQNLARINLLYGAVRSGKTFVSLAKFAKTVEEEPNPSAEFLLVGKTMTSLQRNCFGILNDLCGKNFNFSVSAKKAKLFGKTIWLEGANDRASESKIRGMTLQGAYIDELTQIPEEFYLMCLSRLSREGAFLIATTNPDAPTHYVKSEIIDNDEIDKQVVKFSINDNIHLDPSYIENLKREYTGVFYDRFVLGEFVRAEGLVFSELAENPSGWNISKDDLPNRFKRVEVGFDIGGQGSYHALTATAEGFNGVMYVLKSENFNPSDMNMLDIEKMITGFCEEVESEYRCSIDFINADWVDVVINSINDNTRWRCGKTYKPPLTDRPLTFGRLLATNTIKFVDGKCNDLIEELTQVVFDEKAEKDIMLDDGSQRIDTIDSLTYSLASSWAWLSKQEEKEQH